MLPVLLLVAVWLPGVNQGAFRVDTGLYSAIGLHAWREGPLWPLMAGDAAYFNKPPLALWVHGFFLWVFGAELWVARLPSLLIAIACAEVTRRVASEVCGRRVGLVAACILALTLEFFRYTKAVSLDLWLTLFLMMGAWCVVRALRAPRAGKGTSVFALIVMSGIPIGLGLLVKPIVALLALLIFGAWVVMTGRWKRGAMGLVVAAIVALAVASLWYVPMYLRFGGAFVEHHFAKQAIERATGESFGADPWWYYFGLIGETYWPWMAAVGATIVMLVRSGGLSPFQGEGRGGNGLDSGGGARGLALPPATGYQPFGLRRQDRVGAVMALVWCAVWLVALSVFAGKSGRYAEPVYPMLAWLGAIAVVRVKPRWLVIVRRAAVRWLGPVMIVGAMVVAGFGVRIHAPATAHWAELYEFVRGHAAEEIWAGEGMLPTCANVYLHTGRWPRTVADGESRPAAGALRLYRDEVVPDGSSVGEEVWRSGPMFVVRVGGGR